MSATTASCGHAKSAENEAKIKMRLPVWRRARTRCGVLFNGCKGGKDACDERQHLSGKVKDSNGVLVQSELKRRSLRGGSRVDEDTAASSSPVDVIEVTAELGADDTVGISVESESSRTSVDSNKAPRMRRRMSVSERPGCTVFLDLVGYSKSSDVRQREVANDFMSTLGSLIEKAWGHPPDRVRDIGKFLVLPTGDGAAICVLNAAPGHPSEEFTALWIGAGLLSWAKKRDGVELRCGLNSGLLDTVDDPYGQPNVCGDAINMAARIMDSVRSGQILASTASVVPCLRANSDDEQGIAGLRYHVCPSSNEIIVKHGVTTMVQSITCSLEFDICGSNESNGGDDEDVPSQCIEVGVPRKPLTKWYLKVKPTELEHDANTGVKSKVPPKELLRRHHSIAFVGVTHDRLGRVFASVLADMPSHKWDRVYILFLDDSSLESVTHKNTKIESAADLIRKKRAERVRLEELLTPHVRELGFFEYDRPFHCASYWDWDEPRGFIHVSPLVWGADPKTCPAMDYHWNSKLPGEEYKAYRNGLTSLLMMSKRFTIELDKGKKDEFRRKSDLV